MGGILCSDVSLGLHDHGHGKPSLLGIVTGMLAGLRIIIPTSGYVGPFGGTMIGWICLEWHSVLHYLVDSVVGLWVTMDEETEGLDLVLYDERDDTL